MDNILALVKDACNEYQQLRRIVVEDKAQTFIAKQLDEEVESHPRFVRRVFGDFDVYLDVAVGIPYDRLRRRFYRLRVPDDRVEFIRYPFDSFSILWNILYIEHALEPLPIDVYILGLDRVQKIIKMWKGSHLAFLTKADSGF